MLNAIRSIMQMQFDPKSMRILWAEAVLFSVLFGMIYRSWPVSIALFLILFAFLYSQSRAVYAVFVTSPQ